MLSKSGTEQLAQQTLNVRRTVVIEITNDEQHGFLQLDDDGNKMTMNFVEDRSIIRMINSRRR